jgi:hypothetical protein
VQQRLPIILSATALAVALFGSTPLGHAVVSAVPPFATHAKTADYAKNAGAVSGLKASKRPHAGWLVALAKDGKFPASVGQVGPAGQRGDKGAPGLQGAKGDSGPAGSPGISAYETLMSQTVTLGPNGVVSQTLNCPTGKVPLGGGFNGNATFTESIPFDNGWAVRGQAGAAGAEFNVFVVCAKVAS